MSIKNDDLSLSLSIQIIFWIQRYSICIKYIVINNMFFSGNK